MLCRLSRESSPLARDTLVVAILLLLHVIGLADVIGVNGSDIIGVIIVDVIGPIDLVVSYLILS